jgi:hypothetical protein
MWAKLARLYLRNKMQTKEQGCGSSGRALVKQVGGPGFDPHYQEKREKKPKGTSRGSQ